ncbi:MAG: DNA endonuclease SmrA [Alcanivorax sp.]|nr:DNA endonuclease SmrA [Alcanivorax sp.]
MGSQDDELFRREMADVVPQKPDDRIQDREKPRETLRQKLRRAAAVDERRDDNPLTVPDQVDPIGPHDIVGMKKNGVQEGVYRKLRLGKYDAQDVLDLHRVRLLEARQQVYQFLSRSYQHSLRTVVITHGKGQHSPRPGLLKSYVMHWLQEFDLVLAFHSAPQNRGGGRAPRVRMRNNTHAPQQNPE